MKIFLYKSILCPRCALAEKYLTKIARQYPEVEIEIIDITTAPHKYWQEGIRMIPAIATETAKASLLWPTKKSILDFLLENGGNLE